MWIFEWCLGFFKAVDLITSPGKQSRTFQRPTQSRTFAKMAQTKSRQNLPQSKTFENLQ